MSSEIRSGSNRTYWIITDGSAYCDGVTDPGLITTIGYGWRIVWIGNSYSEYLSQCNYFNIIPTLNNPDIPSTSFQNTRLSARQVRLWLISKGIDLNNIPLIIDQGISDPMTRQSVQVEWEYAPYIEYHHKWLLPLASGLGLTKTDIDEAFINAKNL